MIIIRAEYTTTSPMLLIKLRPWVSPVRNHCVHNLRSDQDGAASCKEASLCVKILQGGASSSVKRRRLGGKPKFKEGRAHLVLHPNGFFQLRDMNYRVDLTMCKKSRFVSNISNSALDLVRSIVAKGKPLMRVICKRGLNVWLQFQVDPVINGKFFFSTVMIRLDLHALVLSSQLLLEQ